MADEKVRENRLRLTAVRQGLTLIRSRRRDRRALDYGKYWLADASGTYVTRPAGCGLDDIERYLMGDR